MRPLVKTSAGVLAALHLEAARLVRDAARELLLQRVQELEAYLMTTKTKAIPTLDKETVKELSVVDLANVAGGAKKDGGGKCGPQTGCVETTQDGDCLVSKGEERSRRKGGRKK